MRAPRGLSAEEAAAWARLAESVTPLEGRRRPVMPEPATTTIAAKPEALRTPTRSPLAASVRKAPDPVPRDRQGGGLDSHWDRRIRAGSITPDFTLDLHGHGLDAAYTRLMSGIAQARAMNARVILLVTGKPRPVEAADRGARRGAIRAKVLDWLAASSHAPAISAIRKAHIRHGGEGALYIVLKKGS